MPIFTLELLYKMNLSNLVKKNKSCKMIFAIDT